MPPVAAKLAAIRGELKAAGKRDPFTFTSSKITWEVPDAPHAATNELSSPLASLLHPARGHLPALASARYIAQRSGSHNVLVSVRGTVPGTHEQFVRREMVSFLAE
jgi:hypothetical protein